METMKTKTLLITLTLTLTLTMLTACSSSWDDKYAGMPFVAMTASSISIDNESLEFPEQASSQSFSFSVAGYWTASTSASWLSLSATQGNGNGTIVVEAEANSNTQQRTAVITMSNGIESRQVSVTQQGASLPEVSGVSVTDITKHSAQCSFSFSSALLDVTEYGICYNSSGQTPDTRNSTVQRQQGGGKSGNPTFSLNDLKSKTTYQVRAYVVTSMGTLYSETTQFATLVSAPNQGDNQTPQD